MMNQRNPVSATHEYFAQKVQHRFIDIKEVINRTTMSRTTIYELIKENQFPKQIQLTKRSVVWIEAEVDEFINQRIAAARYGRG
jgi:prophage regulatory protein